MKIQIVYKGGIDKEIIECSDYFAHSSGGFQFNCTDGMIFISSADVRKIFQIKEN